MCLAIIILPILDLILSGFFGREVGVSGAQFITCLSVIIIAYMARIGFSGWFKQRCKYNYYHW